jgi:membrane protein YfhO
MQKKFNHRGQAVTIGILLLLPIIYFTPLLLAGLSLIPSDGVTQTLGERVLLGKMIAAGQMPLWNPYLLAGAPLLASLSSGLFYPPHWLFAIFSPLTAMNIVVIATYHLALTGCYLYGRRIGMTRLGGIVCGLAFAFGGFMIAQMGSGSLLAAAAWLPWALLATEHLYQETSWRWIIAGAIFLAMQFFAGDTQIGFFTILICMSYAIFSKFVRKGDAESARFLRTTISMVVCGILLSLVQFIPLRELMGLGGHRSISHEAFSNTSFQPGQILGLILPTGVAGGAVGKAKSSDEIYLYLGLLALILALTALFAKQRNKLFWFWTGALSVSLLFALGEYLPYGPNQLFYDLPLYSRYVPAKNLCFFTFALSVLAGLGASFIGQMEREKAKSVLLSASAVFILIVILAFWCDLLAQVSPAEDERSDSSTLFIALLTISFAILSLLAVRLYALRRNLVCSMLVVIVLLVDVMVFGLDFHRDRRPAAASIKERLQDPPTVQFIKSLERDLNSFRIVSYSAKSEAASNDLLNLPNLSLTRGLQSVNGIEELHSPWQAALTGPMKPDGSIADTTLFDPENRALNLLNVKYCLLEESPPVDQAPKAEIDGAKFNKVTADLIPPHWRRLNKFDDVVIYENPRFLPRAWFVKQLAVASSSEISQIVKSGYMANGATFDPSATALLASEYYPHPDSQLPIIKEPVNAKVDVSRYESNRIELKTTNDEPGFLVLSELYYRGWDARVDGRRTPIELVNSALRGIAVPAGEHRVEFVFLAHSMRNGAAYGLLAILFLLAGAIVNSIIVNRRGTGRLKRLVPSPTHILQEQAREMVRNIASRVNDRSHLLSLRLRALFAFIRLKALIIVALLGLGIYGYQTIRCAQDTVGGSDSYGYLSYARLISQGNMVRPVIQLAQLDLPTDYNFLFIPLAYVEGKDPETMAPVYPPGLPLHYVISALILGWEIGPFIIAPLAATASLILIYLLGLELGLSRNLSFAGAVMLATNPTATSNAMLAMSDGPSTFWALVAIFASLRSKKAAFWAVIAGFSFGVAFLTRPTNILLLLPIFFSLRLNLKTLVYFGLGGLPVAAVFLISNTIAYGNPLMTGYVATKHQKHLLLGVFKERFRDYIYWVSKFMSPFILLGWLGTGINREISWRNRGLILSWFGIFFLFYCFYFPYDEQWYARFLLPGIPALILGSLLTLRYITNYLKKYFTIDTQSIATRVITASFLVVVISSGIHYILFFNIFKAGEAMDLNKEASNWAAQIVPKNALIASKEMSGPLMLYADREILRYDYLTPQAWEVLKKRAAEKGYSFYALLMPQEVPTALKNLTGKWKQLGTYKYHMSLWQIEPSP